MYPVISEYVGKDMDDFIESYKALFESHSGLLVEDGYKTTKPMDDKNNSQWTPPSDAILVD